MRTVVWFSCGAASAVAAKLAVEKYDNCVVAYCDTLAYEHPDNGRFLRDVETWIGHPILLLKSSDYTDIMDVFRRTRWLVGPKGARCTTEMKKNVRKEFQEPDDIQVFGFTSEEAHRIERFKGENFEVKTDFILHDRGLTKGDCFRILREAAVELPEMYRMGYRNNNCIGCVKGGMGYWNKIRDDFPDDFKRMAGIERELDVAILKDRTGGKRRRLFLDELPFGVGRYNSEPDIECGVLCTSGIDL